MTIGRRRPGRLTWADVLDQRLMAHESRQLAIVAMLADALEEYGHHDEHCFASQLDAGECNCGLDEIKSMTRAQPS